MSTTNSILIDAVSPEQQRHALTLLFRSAPPDERAGRVNQALQDALEQPELLSHLIGAYFGDQLAAVAWAQPLPGRTALIWGPMTLSDDPTVSSALLESMLARLSATNVRVAQHVLEEGDPATLALLTELGFSTPVQLLYLLSTPLCKPAAATPLVFEPYDPSQHARLARLIDATYEQTWDVPLLNGVRSLDDVIEGYRNTGIFDPDIWYFVSHANQDVGVLLLTDHPRFGYLELVYMGLVSSVRGRGWGAHLVDHALHQLPQRQREHLILAVDAANLPARRVYNEAGFVQLQRRHVSIKILGSRSF